MKKTLASALLALCALPAFASVDVGDIVVTQSKTAHRPNKIQVLLENRDQRPCRVEGLQLQVRNNAFSPWRTLKLWPNPLFVEAGGAALVEYTPPVNPDPALLSSDYELQATLDWQADPVLDISER